MKDAPAIVKDTTTTTKDAAPTPTTRQKRRLRSHFGFSKLPFGKTLWAAHMFDSQSQRELLDALLMWSDVKGVALVTGPTGVGKSITLRRFITEIDETRFHVIEFPYLPTTATGFLRSLCRKLGLPLRQHRADLFDAVQTYLKSYQQEHGAHPILLIDNGEGLSIVILDLLRRLTCYELDAEDRFSLLLAGTDELLAGLRDPSLASLRTRIGYAHLLRSFSLEDTRNYIHFHLQRAEVDPKLVTDEAIKRLFQTSHGRPRTINQLAMQSFIQAAVVGRDTIDGEFLAHLIAAHPLYQSQGQER
jgi:type II secretory pathway predicted ATPase ExeA